MEEAVCRAAFGFLAVIKRRLKKESSNNLLNVCSAYWRYWRSVLGYPFTKDKEASFHSLGVTSVLISKSASIAGAGPSLSFYLVSFTRLLQLPFFFPCLLSPALSHHAPGCASLFDKRGASLLTLMLFGRKSILYL